MTHIDHSGCVLRRQPKSDLDGARSVDEIGYRLRVPETVEIRCVPVIRESKWWNLQHLFLVQPERSPACR